MAALGKSQSGRASSGFECCCWHISSCSFRGSKQIFVEPETSNPGDLDPLKLTLGPFISDLYHGGSNMSHLKYPLAGWKYCRWSHGIYSHRDDHCKLPCRPGNYPLKDLLIRLLEASTVTCAAAQQHEAFRWHVGFADAAAGILAALRSLIIIDVDLRPYVPFI